MAIIEIAAVIIWLESDMSNSCSSSRIQIQSVVFQALVVLALGGAAIVPVLFFG